MAAETGDLSVSVEKRVSQQGCCNIFVRTKVDNKQNHYRYILSSYDEIDSTKTFKREQWEFHNAYALLRLITV